MECFHVPHIFSCCLPTLSMTILFIKSPRHKVVGNFTALKSDSAWMLQLQESHSDLAIFSEEEIHEDSLISRLLWWLTAAIILGKVSWKSNGFDPKILNQFKLGTPQSLLDLIENECDESFKNRFGSEDYWLSTASWHYLLSAPLSYICTVSSFLCLQFSGMLFCLAYWVEC